MKRAALIEAVVEIILTSQCNHPLRVAVDGVDASGKTTFVSEIAQEIAKNGGSVIRVSVDDFHNPKAIRLKKGDLSPEGFYLASYDYQALISWVLIPLGPKGNRQYRSACHDLVTDQPIDPPWQLAPKDAIVLIDGIFLLRPLLLPYWDLKIYLDVDFEESLKRGINRDAEILGSKVVAALRYQKRYIPGQKIYFGEAHPLDKADILIDNCKLETPKLLKRPKGSLYQTSAH